MPFNELEKARIDRIIGGFCRKRIPSNCPSPQIKTYYLIRGFEVRIIESRSILSSHVWSDMPVAKLQYNQETWEWSLYWRNLSKWQRYKGLRPTGSLRSIIDTISEDPNSLFWGKRM